MPDELTAARQEILRHRPVVPPADPHHFKAVEDALAALRRSARELTFYPAGHPTLNASLERLYAQLRQLAELEDPLSLTITPEGVTHRLGDLGKANPHVRALGAELFLCQVRRVHFGRDFTPEELRVFLALSAKDPKKILLEGGPDVILAAANVRNIQVNALRFEPVGGDEANQSGGAGMGEGGESLTEAVAPAQGEEQREAPTQTPERTSEGGGFVGGGGEKAELLMQVADASVVIEEETLSLDDMLARLEVADGLEYRRLAGRLDVAARNAVAHGDVEQFLRIASTFTRHRDDPARPEDICAAASQWVEEIVEAGGVDFLVEKVCQRETAHSEEIFGFLSVLGATAVDALLLRLTLEESMSARRRLLVAIVRQGEQALPPVVRLLEDDRWYVARNMATLLTDLGGESAVEPLARQLRHRERRVRREVARALAKIGGGQAHRYLRDCLADADPGVRQAAVVFLGSARDQRALPRLRAIAEERAWDREERELRTAAIQALAQLRDWKAVPVLARLVRPGSWFRRAESDEIRVAAASALGQLGGPQAVEALERAEGSGGWVGEACRRALARLGV